MTSNVYELNWMDLFEPIFFGEEIIFKILSDFVYIGWGEEDYSFLLFGNNLEWLFGQIPVPSIIIIKYGQKCHSNATVRVVIISRFLCVTFDKIKRLEWCRPHTRNKKMQKGRTHTNSTLVINKIVAKIAISEIIYYKYIFAGFSFIFVFFFW